MSKFSSEVFRPNKVLEGKIVTEKPEECYDAEIRSNDREEQNV